MQENFELSTEQAELEAELRKLSLGDCRINAISAAFTAGRRSMRLRLAAWQASAGLMLLLVASISLRAFVQRPARPQLPVAGATGIVAAPAEAIAPPQPQSLAVLEKTVRDGGLDALPSPALPEIKPLYAGELF
jgi:hypothetical protein